MFAEDMHGDVGRFHRKFDLPNTLYDGINPQIPDHELLEFRIKFMQEELDEFKKSVEGQDLTGMFDALIDLVYVALGTAHLCRLPWYDGWRIVQEANMQKKRAERAEDSARGSTFDVVKPPDWVPPNILRILESYGYPPRKP